MLRETLMRCFELWEVTLQTIVYSIMSYTTFEHATFNITANYMCEALRKKSVHKPSDGV